MDGFQRFRRGAFRLLLATALPAGSMSAGLASAETLAPSRAAVAVPKDIAEVGRVLAEMPQRIDVAKARLLAAVAEFRKLLEAQDAESRQGWLAYLHLDEMVAALDGPRDAQIEAMVNLRLRMRADIEGLELEQAVNLRAAATQYAAELRLLEPGVEARVYEAAELLRATLLNGGELDPLAAEQVGAAVGLLEQVGVVPELVDAVRQRWTYPNVWVRVKTEFVAKYVARDVSDYRMQTATILGTQTSGPVATQGTFELATVPNDATAQFELRLRGSTRSPGNIGRNGPATIYSSASSQFSGRKTIYFDPRMGVADSPAGISCNASIGIKQIAVEPRVLPTLLQPAVQRVAWNKANESQAAVRQEVQRLTSRRIAERVEAEIADPLKTVQDYYYKYAIVGPLRLDDLPTVVSRSTSDYFEIGVRQANRSQVSVSAERPELHEDTKIALQVHESIFHNSSGRALFGDCILTDEEIENYCQFVAMQVPPPIRVFSNSTPWSIVCDIERPATFRFEDGTAGVTIHTLQWNHGDKSYTRPINVQVRYKVENSVLGMLFTRIGGIEVTAVDGRPWTSEERSELLPFIHEKCGAVFQEQGRFSSLILPRGEGFGPFGEIELKQVESDGGWFTMGYQ
jgi:hypothetical protein